MLCCAVYHRWRNKSHTLYNNNNTIHPNRKKMISDAQLYSLAVFCGSTAVLLIVLYHFLEINSDETHAKLPEEHSSAMRNVVKVGEKEFVGVKAGGLGVAQ